MNFKSFEELKEIIARNDSRIRDAVERKYGHQEDDFVMEFTFADQDGNRYHCILIITNSTSLSVAYAFNDTIGIDLGRTDSEPGDADFIMQDLADDIDRYHADPDTFIYIDLTEPDSAYPIWDPLDI